VQIVVELALVDQLGVFCVDGLDLHGHLEVCLCVYGLVDLPEGALVDLADDLEVFTHLFQHLRHRNIKL
jgi:hypothetical protein